MKSPAASHEAGALTREEEQAEVIRRLEDDIIFGRFAPGSRLDNKALRNSTEIVSESEQESAIAVASWNEKNILKFYRNSIKIWN